jgi:chemotaxis protein CheC
LQLVRAVVGEDGLSDESELATDAISETGNIVLGCWMSTLANQLRQNLHMSPPKVITGDAPTILGPKTGDYVLFLRIDFEIDTLSTSGFLALLMDLPSIHALRALLNDFVARVS